MVNLNKPENYAETAEVDARTCELLIPSYEEVAAAICFQPSSAPRS